MRYQNEIADMPPDRQACMEALDKIAECVMWEKHGKKIIWTWTFPDIDIRYSLYQDAINYGSVAKIIGDQNNMFASGFNAAREIQRATIKLCQ